MPQQAAGQTNVGAGGAPRGAGARSGPASNLRKRNTGASSKASSSTPMRANDNSMWKFYTEDSPGIKVGPVPVLIMSLAFIACVFVLHIWGKFPRSRAE